MAETEAAWWESEVIEPIFAAGGRPDDDSTTDLSNRLTPLAERAVINLYHLQQTKTWTANIIEGLETVLAAAGCHSADVVKTTVFLADFGDFQKMNEVYATYFKDQPPARSTVGVSTLPKNARVEIEAIAFADESDLRSAKSVSDTSG
jgi:reactive intermediate/imine deaminase